MAVKEQPVLLKKRNHIGYITLNRPERLNAMRHHDYELLDDLITECDKDDNIKIIILTGKGKAFSVGDDFEGYTGGPKENLTKNDHYYGLLGQGKFLEAQLSGFRIPLQKSSLTLMNSGKVCIAALNGVCWAPEILYAVDFVIAADVASIGQGDIMIGICPGGGSTQTLPRLLGRRRAIEVILRPRAISAQEAYRIGLVNKVVPLARLMPEVEALAKEMMVYPSHAIKLTKMAITKAQELPIVDGLDLEQWYMNISSQSEYTRNFAKNFWAKKKSKNK
jgi:enoyl-CoA hydratase/carnithine racemase